MLTVASYLNLTWFLTYSETQHLPWICTLHNPSLNVRPILELTLTLTLTIILIERETRTSKVNETLTLTLILITNLTLNLTRIVTTNSHCTPKLTLTISAKPHPNTNPNFYFMLTSKLRKHLTKGVRDLHIENHKTFKGIEEGTKTWKDIWCSWMGTMNLIKKVLLVKAITWFNVTPIKIPMAEFFKNLIKNLIKNSSNFCGITKETK